MVRLLFNSLAALKQIISWISTSSFLGLIYLFIKKKKCLLLNQILHTLASWTLGKVSLLDIKTLPIAKTGNPFSFSLVCRNQSAVHLRYFIKVIIDTQTFVCLFGDRRGISHMSIPFLWHCKDFWKVGCFVNKRARK